MRTSYGHHERALFRPLRPSRPLGGEKQVAEVNRLAQRRSGRGVMEKPSIRPPGRFEFLSLSISRMWHGCRASRNCLSCGAGCPACRIADGPSARRVKNDSLLSTRLVPFAAPQAGQPAKQQTGLSALPRQPGYGKPLDAPPAIFILGARPSRRLAAAGWRERKRHERRAPASCGCTAPVHPDVVGRAGLFQPAAHWMQNIMLRRRAGTDAPYLHHRQHRDAPAPRVQRNIGLSGHGEL